MQASFVLTVLSDDKPGLVKTISDVINEYDGSWTDSRMIHMAGKFAGLLRVSVPEDQVDELIADLTSLQDEGIEIAIETISQGDSSDSVNTIEIEVLGQESPGIINAITNQLEILSVNIEELHSEQRPAPMSSELLFYAKMTLSLPEGVESQDVQSALEDMPDQLVVDIDFS